MKTYYRVCMVENGHPHHPCPHYHKTIESAKKCKDKQCDYLKKHTEIWTDTGYKTEY